MPSPLTTTFIQSTILNAIANLLAQIIDHHRKSKSTFTINTPALLQFLIYGILIVPINFIWQRYLEEKFPGALLFRRSPAPAPPPPPPTISTNTKKKRNEGDVYISIPAITGTSTTLKEKPFQPKARGWGRGRGGWTNFLMKFLLDQTIGSVMNIVLFVVLINLLKGVDVAGVVGLVQLDFKPIMIARLKYRPLVSMLMYTVVPVDRRVVFGSACGVVWGVYLSLYAVV
ncbi:uncharacterized protein BO80DRAFT_416251 [Aspergillus ibericus CBS 121593]|uniref:Integral membrane protein, Mpv17/PMP22 family n=1 Tax=Aspergillus ibericus CBS 121593 TaxID=1448316 RepID=A0A395GPE6_9EURO|nr:hypothetical protein BO80DRAFT_416251 [Aspergillus ibericus CBS 121593]RAK96717.1 hypothetical protein BO80DRAFT_416251 [Aspergillus ibericus CBS 121593]